MPAEVSEGESTLAAPPSALSPVPVAAVPVESAIAALPPDERVTHRCANCLTPLAGPFCSQCGQHVADYHRSLWRFVADFFDNTLCWDNKILRTLGPLLKRPGWLTQEFMAGRRVRYVHPLRLFLFTSAICLTLIQFMHRDAKSHVRVSTGQGAKPGVSVQLTDDKDKDDDDDDKESAASSPAPPTPATPAPPATSPAAVSPSAPATPATPVEPTLGQVFRDTYKAGNGKSPADAIAAEKLENATKKIEEAGKQIETAAANGSLRERVTANIQQRLSWMTLAMLPIFALLMRWAYGRWGGYYFTYLVFSLHYHTFLLLFWVAYTSLDNLASRVNSALFQLPGLIVGLCLLLPPYYLYRALRQMYGQGRAATWAKTLAVGSLHLLVLFTGLAIIGATSFL